MELCVFCKITPRSGIYSTTRRTRLGVLPVTLNTFLCDATLSANRVETVKKEWVLNWLVTNRTTSTPNLQTLISFFQAVTSYVRLDTYLITRLFQLYIQVAVKLGKHFQPDE